MEFPPELVDRFIDYLHDDIHALANCALVSRTWAPSSRYHVFGHVVLSDVSWTKFLRLLTSPFATFTPHSTHTLTFATTPRSNTTLASLLDDIMPKLPQFPAVTSLCLGILNWSEISSPTVTALAALFVSITALDIRHIQVHDVHELAGVISLFPNLQKMSVTPFFLGDSADIQVAPFPDLPRGLVHVALTWYSPSGTRDMLTEVLLWLEGTSTQPSPVQSLALAIVDTPTLPALGRLLRVLGSQLQALDVAFTSVTARAPVTTDDIENHIDLSENPNLRDLTVHVSASDHTWGLMSAVRAPIRTLAIHLSLYSHASLDDLDWTILITTLSKNPHFSALQRLHFVVFSLRNDEVQALDAAVRARVAECDARGIVDVKVMRRP
ncbi:hypothetical protein C8R46DRAFT_1115477 [Mycena filopes]|nr:hypothetical protein C8R46DRAFT_1115477 [Mycena filopes]